MGHLGEEQADVRVSGCTVYRTVAALYTDYVRTDSVEDICSGRCENPP